MYVVTHPGWAADDEGDEDDDEQDRKEKIMRAQWGHHGDLGMLQNITC